jgi:hypothetical protein
MVPSTGTGIARLSKVVKNLLFVVGCPRSGTTELTYLLNSHKDIAIGVERYLYIYPRLKKCGADQPFDATWFSEEKFSRIESDETFYKSIDDMPGWDRGVYTSNGMRAKFRSANIVGDKAPVGLFYVEDIASRFPSAKFVIVLRDLISVARSWQARADNVSDTLWKREDGFAAAIPLWISYVRHGRALAKLGIPTFSIFVPQMYKTGDQQISRMLSFVQAGHDHAFEQVIDARREAAKSRNKESAPTKQELKHLSSHKWALLQLAEELRGSASPYASEDLLWSNFGDDLMRVE